MQSYSIALSGLSAAQKALEIIGNNVANAATEGYHRQRIELAPAYASQLGSVLVGGGVDIVGVTRIIDVLLEQEVFRQQSSLGQVSQELNTLQTIESALGEFSVGGGLSATIDQFFSALQDLSAHPSGIIWQRQAATAARTLASQFRTLAEFLTTLEAQIALEAENAIDQVNALIGRIAELNGSIKKMEAAGGQANNLRDQRDECVKELSELIGVEIQSREYGVVDVNIAGIAVVMGVSATELEVGLDMNNRLGISAAGAHNYVTSVQGGRLGGLLSLKNGLVSDIHDDLDALAKAIIQQVNQYHVQGVGSEGSFGKVAGWKMGSEDLADLDPPVTNGTIYVRVINTSTGEITRHAIDVDVSTDSLTTIAAKIHAIDGLTASWSTTGGLHIQAETDYRFDFLPAALPEPTENNLTGSSPTISVSGIYTGTQNDTFEFTVVGSGSVGNGDLQLEVKNGAGELVATLNVGAGYAAGDKLDACSGIEISLSTGELVAGETFKIDVFADTDTSGVLAAVGINTFFSGNSAANMGVCSDIINSPGRIATALGVELTDNANMLRLAALKDRAMSSLNGMTPREFYHQLVADVGQKISVKQMRQDNIEAMVQNLANRQSETSGVNINDEAAQMLIFEQMFQAMAKYMSTIQSSMLALMEMV